MAQHPRSSRDQTVGGTTRQLSTQGVDVELAVPLAVTPSRTEPRWLSRTSCSRSPFPPFTVETALTKLWLVEAAWNGFDPHLIAVACTPNSLWRSKDVYLVSRAEIVEILTLTRYREPIPHSVWHCGHSATTGSAGVHCEYTDAPAAAGAGYGVEL